MRLITAVLITACIATLGACGSESEQPSRSNAENREVEGDFYKRLTGTIAGKPVVMHLHRFGDWVGGSYAYNTTGIPISLASWNDATPGDDVFELQEFSEAGPLDESYTYPRLQLTLTNDGVEGAWISADSGRRFTVELREDYGNGSVRLRTYSFLDSASLFQTLPAPQATASYSTVAPTDGDASWLGDAIRSSFGERTAPSWPEFFRALAGTYFSEYRSSVQVDSTNPSDLESAMHNWTTESRATVVMNEKDWLVIRSLSASYSGGAHGNYGSSFLVLDRRAKREWKLGDVVADTSALAPFLAAAALDRFGIPPENELSERLLVNNVPVTGNFYLTLTGLAFVYNPYEIASYADGEVHLFIPYKRITMLLSEGFKQRMGLGNVAVMRG